MAFSETNARYVVEIKSGQLDKAVNTLINLGVPFSIIGSTGGDNAVVRWGHHELMALKLDTLKMAYNSLWGAL
ncbi:hypothetical protein [Vulcanisaeta sp. JCM 16161]|uniref:hypothetical protein n=1 Tax=Vulcanisaeta sp. JCM 16161 TaxID=1295372 RepID=UPI001FB52149|nr:hypothetical protein [Vulcanisaeta sp. JCM 16161]